MTEQIVPQHPELAMLVARIIASSAITEAFVSLAFATIIGDKGPATHAILHRVRNISERINMLDDLSKAFRGQKTADEIAPLIETLKVSNRRRVILAHGLWSEDDKGIQVYTNMFNASRKFNSIEVSIEILETWLAEISDLNQSLFP